MQVRCPHCENAILVVPEEPLDSISCPSCGHVVSLVDSAAETTSHKHVARVVGKFQLLERLGAGSYGTVYKARDTELNRFVAVKLPHAAVANSTPADFFLREARAAARLSHPHIVEVYEVGRDNDSVYIVSKYIEGVDLADWVRQYRPDYRRAAELIAQLAAALHHAHEVGVIHRDIKPTNVLMDGAGKPYITDFGLAKQAGAEATIAADGRLLGTPAYMSPEQARGEGTTADARSDVYSLGVLLYEMLTGKRPFTGGGQRVLLYQIIHDDAVSPRKHDRQIPRDLAQICLKAMEKKPQDRYATARELEEDLQRFLRNEPVRARPVPPWTRVRRWTVRNPAWAAAAAFLLLALVASVVAGSIATRPPAGSIPVRITTQPAGARVVCYRLDERTRLPVAKIRSSSGGVFWRRTPMTLHLQPGDYLVIAYVDEDTFHEVYRRVPADLNASPGIYPHLNWSIANDQVVWPTIKLHRSSQLERQMVSVPGGEVSADRIGTRNRGVVVPDLLVDGDELDATAVQSSGVSYIPEQHAPGPTETAGTSSATRLSWDQAVAVLEARGTRLPTRALALHFSQRPETQVGGAIQNLFSGNCEWLADGYDAVFRLTIDNSGKPNFIGRVAPVGVDDLGLRGVRQKRMTMDATPIP